MSVMPTPVVITAFVDAVNSGNTATLLALFDTAGVVDDWGSRYVGHDQIRTWSNRELIGVEATLDIVSSEQHGNEASVLARVGGNGFSGASRFSFTMDGARIKEMRITAD
jgi:hypothetical protein